MTRVQVLAVVGVGLIGGSLAAALRSRGAVGRVLGAGRSRGSLQRAHELGLVDEIVTIPEAAARADVIVVATPVGAMSQVLRELLPALNPQALITDVGSTKASVVVAARAAMGHRIAQFVPGHPIAGAETTGPEAADPALYERRTVVLTPLPENSPLHVQRLGAIWETCGARVITMDAAAHDAALASVSHVPHFLSSVYMGQVAASEDADRRLSLAGTGFRDFTRIAAGSPEMWRDIFLANREAVLVELAQVRQALESAEQALDEGDGQSLHTLLERAALARRLWGGRSET